MLQAQATQYRFRRGLPRHEVSIGRMGFIDEGQPFRRIEDYFLMRTRRISDSIRDIAASPFVPLAHARRPFSCNAASFIMRAHASIFIFIGEAADAIFYDLARRMSAIFTASSPIHAAATLPPPL